MFELFDTKVSGKLDVVRNTEHSLILQRSKTGAFFGAIFSTAIFIAFSVFAIRSNDEDKNVFLFFLGAFAILALPSIYLSLKASFVGETYKFQKKRKRIYKNNKKWFNFKEIVGIEIAHYYDSEHDWYDYKLSLISVGRHKYGVFETSDLNEVTFIADEIALVLGLKLDNIYH